MAVRSNAMGQVLPPVEMDPLPGLEVVEGDGVLESNLLWLEWQRVERQFADTVPMELAE